MNTTRVISNALNLPISAKSRGSRRGAVARFTRTDDRAGTVAISETRNARRVTLGIHRWAVAF